MKNEISTVVTRNAADNVQKLENAYGSNFELKLQKSKSAKSGGNFSNFFSFDKTTSYWFFKRANGS